MRYMLVVYCIAEVLPGYGPLRSEQPNGSLETAKTLAKASLRQKLRTYSHSEPTCEALPKTREVVGELQRCRDRMSANTGFFKSSSRRKSNLESNAPMFTTIRALTRAAGSSTSLSF